MHQNVEIKAKSNQNAIIRQWLQQNQARFAGLDEQTDTYFKVPAGRLKLRQGNVENALIYYERANTADAKLSKVTLYQVQQNSEQLLQLLAAANGVWAVVKKRREIWFLENVKFHLDEVAGLGTFMEIEAIDADGSLGYDYILQQLSLIHI